MQQLLIFDGCTKRNTNFGVRHCDQKAKNMAQKNQSQYIEMSAPKCLTGPKKGDQNKPKAGSEACQF